ncbi:MAG: hypothetical protein WC043_08785 [Pseudobdellovibrionaceae bacterium]
MSQNPQDEEAYTGAEYDEYTDQDYDDHDVTDEWQNDDEVLDEDAESGAQESEPPAKKKKSNILTYAIIGVVLLAAGGFAVMSMGGKKAPSGDAAPPAQPTASVAEAPPQDTLQGLRDKEVSQLPVPATSAPPAQEEAKASQGGFMDDPAVLQQPDVSAPQASADLTAPTPSLANAPAPQDPLAGQTPQPAEGTTSTAPVQAVSDFPTADQVMKAGTPETAPPADIAAAPAPVPDVQPAVPTETSVDDMTEVPMETTTSGSSAELLDARSRIAELEKSLAEKDQALKQQQALATDVDTLRGKIVELEDRLASAQAAQNDMTEPPPAETSKPVKAVKTTKAVSQPKTTKPAPSSAQWVLKGAQPGKALVALKGSNDLKTVVVGATLPGIGRVTAIEQSPAGWVVKGTQGSIKQ